MSSTRWTLYLIFVWSVGLSFAAATVIACTARVNAAWRAHDHSQRSSTQSSDGSQRETAPSPGTAPDADTGATHKDIHSRMALAVQALGVRVLDEAALRARSEHGGCECTMCLEAFAVGDELRQLPCKHIFHKFCIDRWLLPGESATRGETLPTCPLCKAAPVDLPMPAA